VPTTQSDGRQIVGAHRFGGPAGNETLTSAAALVLTILLAAEGVTILWLGDLLSAHMIIGLALVPPVLLKLGSTGYRFVRYYTRSRLYRAKGPPLLGLRLLGPVLVVSTVVVFVTGVLLLIAGHREGTTLELHKISFIVWGACFAVHFLAHLPRAARSLRWDWIAPRRRQIRGAGLRLSLLVACVSAGAVLAVALLSPIGAWVRGPF
jgi:hypothetical protein